jgi:hypothetical protein
MQTARGAIRGPSCVRGVCASEGAPPRPPPARSARKRGEFACASEGAGACLGSPLSPGPSPPAEREKGENSRALRRPRSRRRRAPPPAPPRSFLAERGEFACASSAPLRPHRSLSLAPPPRAWGRLNFAPVSDGTGVNSPSPTQFVGEGRGGGRPMHAQHSRTPALPHSRTPALPHSRTPALPHSRTPALSHFRTFALSHFRTFALSHFRTFALSPLPHFRTFSPRHTAC